MKTDRSAFKRVVILGESSANGGFCSNKLQTATYETNTSLLFYGLFRCIFSSVASVYFFTVGLLQMFTPWSPTGKFATMGPYAGNKVFEMIALFWFNKKNRIADQKVNSRLVKVVTRHGVTTKQRKDLKVGDLIHIEEVGGIVNDDGQANVDRFEVPADLLLVYSQTRTVFLDMSSLTGEKDSVQRKVPDGLVIDRPDKSPLYGIMYATEPEADLDSFRGELRVGLQKYDCTHENILLAGSYLFKGKDVYGIVLATGKDTKIRLKQDLGMKKSWYLQRRLNYTTTATLLLLLSFILLGTYGYLDNEPVGVDILQAVAIYFLLFNGLIAQTQQFTLDAVRGVQIMEVDAEVKNPCAVEELGLVQAIVFDKTGTLTMNKLQPQVWSVMGDRKYIIHDKKRGNPIVIPHEEITPQLVNLLMGICLNNSVMRSQDASQRPNYFGTSADEVTLLESAYNSVGYFIVDRNVSEHGDHLQLHTLNGDDGIDSCWDVLHTFKYTSKKGMMTVLVRNQRTKEVFFYSKGSPHVMYPYLRASDRQEAKHRVDELSNKGLRVLLYAYVKLDWDTLEEQFYKAKSSPDAVAISSFRRGYLRNMTAIGVTGTEDQLQPHLAETMQKLQEAGITTLVCTGDVKLTAENIGKNCGILPMNGKIFDIDEHPDYSLDVQLETALRYKEPKGLLVGKEQLMTILEDKGLTKMFFELVHTCQGVVTYRAHPKLKAQLAKLLMDHGLITCCVGDGANDIDMIKQANVGVGIKDGENSHAAGSADLAIKRVGDLPALIFHHGKQNWERNTKMAHLISGMKMTVVVALLFFDVIYNDFTAKALFSGRMLLAFNFFYGWATAVYGICHNTLRDPKIACMKPILFKKRPGPGAMSLWVSLMWWGCAALDAFICLVICMWWWGDAASLPSIPFLGESASPSEFCMFVVLMIWVNTRVSLESDHLFVHLSVAATIGVFLVVTLVPAWRVLPLGFFPFVVGMTLLFLAYNWGIKQAYRRVRKVLWNKSYDLLEELMKEEEAKRHAEVAKAKQAKDEGKEGEAQQAKEKGEPKQLFQFVATPTKSGKDQNSDNRLRVVSIVDDLEDDQDLVRRRMNEAIKRKQETAAKEVESFNPSPSPSRKKKEPSTPSKEDTNGEKERETEETKKDL